MLAKLRNYIITGFLVLLPLVISIWLISWLFVTLTNIVLRWLPAGWGTHPLGKLGVRLIIPIGLLVLLALVGIITRVVFVRKVFSLGERLLVKIPLFNKIYITVKQISQAIVSSKKTLFKHVVLIEYPRKGLYSIGFVTSRTRGEVQAKTREDVVNVFVPTTPNPTSGMLVFARPKELIELDMSVEDGLKLLISGGAVTPNHSDTQMKEG